MLAYASVVKLVDHPVAGRLTVNVESVVPPQDHGQHLTGPGGMPVGRAALIRRSEDA